MNTPSLSKGDGVRELGVRWLRGVVFDPEPASHHGDGWYAGRVGVEWGRARWRSYPRAIYLVRVSK